MSTENTQTDVTPSDVSAESVSVNQGSQETASLSLDTMKQMAKDGTTFKPKTIDESVKEASKPETPSTPTYQPNYKYKAALQEKEIEEFWRPLIKDQESEKKIKDVLTRLDGFDAVKASREKLQTEYESLTQDYQAQAQVVQRVEGALERGDLTSVFRQLGVNDEAIFRWTQQKLQMMEMPPEQRKMFEDAENARLERQQYEEQMSQFQRMYEEQAVQARTIQLDLALARPEVVQASQTWDQAMGQPGAFKDLVIQEAQAAYYRTGQDLSAEQAVQLVMQKFGKVMPLQGGGVTTQAAPQVQAPPSQTPQVTVPQAKPVIPNVSGKGASPVKKVPRSLDDLHAMRKQLEAGGSL